MSDGIEFEETLADVQSEIISVSLEYCGPSVSDIYVYASTENGSMFFDPFFVVEGHVVSRGNLAGVDTSIPRQRALVKYGNAQLMRLWDAGVAAGRPVPSQLKLHYSVVKGSLDGEYEYGPQYSNSETLSVHDISSAWKAEIQRSLTVG